MLIVEWNLTLCCTRRIHRYNMRNIIKHLAYIILMIAVTGVSAQSLYARHEQCEHASTPSKQNIENQHCQQLQSNAACDCNDCNCNIHINSQINSTSNSSIFQFHCLMSEVTNELSTQYTQYFHNPLLRPPIC